jgi:hypothetical protein
VEQQLAAGAGERQVAELVEHNHVEPGELGRQGLGLTELAMCASIESLAIAGYPL